MPFKCLNNGQPKENSLVVCAGTITCRKIDGMGSGFTVFKEIFNKNVSCNNNQGGWHAELQSHLESFFNKEQPKTMPSYIRIAQQDTLMGGVATVPIYDYLGLTHEQFSDNDTQKRAYKAQYSLAVKQAVLDAKTLERPLFLQPLGIGVYGWNPELAATLFVDAIIEVDPNDEVDIIIPIFQTDKNSPDQLFRERFETFMIEKRPIIKKESPRESIFVDDFVEVDLNDEVSITTPTVKNSPNQLLKRNFETLMIEKRSTVKKESPGESVKSINKNSTDAITTVTPKNNTTTNQNALVKMIEQLIENIEKKQGNRWTSGVNSTKITTLKTIKASLINNTKTCDEDCQQYIKEITTACEIKRNRLHFWHIPESVGEFQTLLINHPITINSSVLKTNV